MRLIVPRVDSHAFVVVVKDERRGRELHVSSVVVVRARHPMAT